MSSVEAIRKASKEIANANKIGFGSVILQQIIERGIRDIKTDKETTMFNIDQLAVREVIEILEFNNITDKNL